MRIIAAVLTALLLVAGCGDKDETSAKNAPADPPGASTEGAPVADICAAFTADAATAALGNGTYTATDSPGGGCDYKQDDPRSGSFTVTELDLADSGGFEGYTATWGSLFKDGTVTQIDGVGDSAAVVYGELNIGGGGAHQGAAAAQFGNVVLTVNYSQGNVSPEELGTSAETALRAAAEALH